MSLTSLQKNESPGNNRLTDEFSATFWDNIKDVFFFKFVQHSKTQKGMKHFAKTGYHEKEDKNKRFIKNWQPLSLFNEGYKIISKALASRLKKVVTNLLLPQQPAYIENRYIGESGRLVADIIEITDILITERFFVTMDIEKTFNLLDYTLAISVLKKIGFGNNFVS